MQIAVITPYADEPVDWLRQCHESVRAQSIPAVHYMIADGHPRELGGWFSGKHIVLTQRANDGGHTPRMVGCLAAIGKGFEAVSFLDADNWYLTDHLASLVSAHRETGARVCTSKRTLHHLDGTLLGSCDTSDGIEFCDANCYFMTANFLKSNWPMFDVPGWAGIIVDRILWRRIRNAHIETAHTKKATLCYRTKFAGHYQALGLALPQSIGAPSSRIEQALERWQKEFGEALMFEHRASRA